MRTSDLIGLLLCLCLIGFVVRHVFIDDYTALTLREKYTNINQVRIEESV